MTEHQRILEELRQQGVVFAEDVQPYDDCSLSGRGWLAAVCIGAVMWAGIGAFVWLVW